MTEQMALMEKVAKMEQDVQTLKIALLLDNPNGLPKRVAALYQERDIIKEVKKVRRSLWHGKRSAV